MAMQWTTNAQKVAPSGATGVYVTPSGTAWSNSSWVELTSAVAAASLLTGLIIDNASVSVEFEVDIGTGGSGSESVITTFRGATIDNLGNQGPIQLPIPIDNIANGVRLAVRMRKSGTSTSAWLFAVTYLLKPITGTLLATASPVLSSPSAAVGIAVASSTSWVSGSWVQLIASTPSAIVLVGVQILSPVGTSEWEMDIGTGAAASEAVITTLRWAWNPSAGGDGCPLVLMLPIPLDNIGSGVRVAARSRCSLSTKTVTTALMYHAKPL